MGADQPYPVLTAVNYLLWHV